MNIKLRSEIISVNDSCIFYFNGIYAGFQIDVFIKEKTNSYFASDGVCSIFVITINLLTFNIDGNEI